MNNLIVVKNGATLTTSLVIAEGVENEHKAVIQLVRKYLSDLKEFGEVTFEMALNKQGSSTEYALLNEHQATLLLTYMRNTDIVREFKKRLVKAFFEMAGQLAHPRPVLPDFTNPIIAARAWADEVEQKMQLAQKVEEMKPTVQAYRRLAESEGGICLRDAAKELQVPPLKLNSLLSQWGWIYKRPTTDYWIAYQEKIQAFLLEHKAYTYTSEEGIKTKPQVLVTPKGLAKIAKLLEEMDNPNPLLDNYRE